MTLPAPRILRRTLLAPFLAPLLLLACAAPPPPAEALVRPVCTATGAPAAWSRVPRTMGGVDYVLLEPAGIPAACPLPTVLVLHAMAERPEAVAPLYELPVAARVVVPRGWLPFHDGYAWWGVEPYRESEAVQAEGVGRAADSLARWVAALAATHPRAGRIVVTGMSQGGDLSYAMAVRHPELVAAALPAGARFLAGLRPRWPAARREALRVHAFHGARDTTASYAEAAKAVEGLRADGYDATMTAYDGIAHDYAPPLAEGVRERIARLVRETGLR